MVFKNFPADIRLSNATLYKSLDLLQLHDIYDLELAKFMYKAYYRALPASLNNMFTKIDDVHRYPTSSSRRRVFFSKLTKSDKYKNWISTSGINVWENIENELRDMSFYNFKKEYRKKLIDSY